MRHACAIASNCLSLNLMNALHRTVMLQSHKAAMQTLSCSDSVTRSADHPTTVQEIDCVPYPLLWLRYTTFIVLYPLGGASEMTMVYLAMPTIRKERPLSFSMPNKINFAFDYYWFCWCAIACYIPGLPELYLHMLRQRKKILGLPSKNAKKVA